MFVDPTPTPTKNRCCQLGYYYDLTNLRCRPIESQYCSKQSKSTVNSETGKIDCDECYISSDQCDVDGTLFFDIDDPHYSANFSRTAIQGNAKFINAKKKIQYYHYQNVWMDSNKKQCCLHGEYYSLTEKKCVSLNIKNCLKGELNNTSQTTKCT